MKDFDSTAIGRAAPVKAWIRAMEEAFGDMATGQVDVPPRNHIDRGENTLLLMPCFGKHYFSTKLVSVFPKNVQNREPMIYGTVVLNDAGSGKPLAVMDGSKLTAMRTAAVGSVGIKHLAREDASSLGIIGLGIQGLHQALFACETRPIKQLRILDRSRDMMKRFKERFAAFFPGIEVIPCRSSLELCKASDIIITATGSHQPVVPGSGNWWKGKTIVGIGSYKPQMREFPDEMMADLEWIYVDTLHGLQEAGDLTIPLEKGIIREEQCIPMADVITGKKVPEGETRFFKSVGMAAFDLYGAKLVYERLA